MLTENQGKAATRAPADGERRRFLRAEPSLLQRRSPVKGAAFDALGGVASALIGGLSLLLAVILRTGWPWVDGGVRPEAEPYVALVGFAAIIRGLVFVAHRHSRNRRCRGWADEIAEALREAAVGSTGIVFLTFFWRGGSRYRTFSYSRGVFLVDFLIAGIALAALLIGTKAILGRLRREGHNVRLVAVVGDSAEARSFIDHVSDHPETGYQVVGHLCGRRKTDGDFVTELAELAEVGPIDELVLATTSIERYEIARLVSVSQFSHMKVRALPELFGLPPTKVSLDLVGQYPLLSLFDDPLRGPRRAMKRMIDVGFAVVALVVLSPVMALAAIAVRLSSPGGILFRQDRVGMDGRPFRMLKFRTMYAGVDSAKHREYVLDLIKADPENETKPGLYKLDGDPRVTKVGTFLRKLSIDELPQLFNVLRGDMSIVGPRPSLPYELEAYEDWHRRRCDVRPGMTGLWQVSGRSKLNYHEMVRLDLTYIETWSPLRDLIIILQTIPAVFRDEAS